MKIIFFGTSELALPGLKALLDTRYEVSAVVTQPDRKKGRHLVLTPPPVKVLALEKGLSIHQPDDLADSAIAETLKSYVADLFVVVSYGQILSREVLDIPGLFCINLHFSLLPAYRGAAPINWAIINGETKSGATVIKMNEHMDRGDIILQKKINIEKEDTAVELSDKLAKFGAEVLVQAIDLIESGKASFTPQDEALASYAPKLKKEDGLIDWALEAHKIHNRVRGLLSWPGTFTRCSIENKDYQLKLWKTEVAELPLGEGQAGEVAAIIKHKGIVVRTGENQIIIKELQLEGGKRMSAADFIIGHRIEVGDVLG